MAMHFPEQFVFIGIRVAPAQSCLGHIAHFSGPLQGGLKLLTRSHASLEIEKDAPGFRTGIGCLIAT